MTRKRRTASVVTYSWDPFHGDEHYRHPKLGAPIKRVIPLEQWKSPAQKCPAIYGNGIYADFAPVAPMLSLEALRARRAEIIIKSRRIQ